MKKSIFKKSSLLVIALIVLIVGAVGSTAGYLITSAAGESLIFYKPEIRCEVIDTKQFENAAEIKIRNAGNVDVYVRATIVTNWKDASGNVYAFSPKQNGDYDIIINTSNWFVGSDGYYYYKTVLGEGSDTASLISSCSLTSIAPEGYSFALEVVADVIQSSPANVVAENWNVTVLQDGTISK